MSHVGIPDPFPGRYPTRWLLVCQDRGKRVFQYWGKPNPAVMLKFLKLLRTTQPYDALLAEADRTGFFRLRVLTTPWKNFIPPDGANNVLQYAYYPWNSHNDFFGPWRKSALLKRFVSKMQHQFVCYVPADKQVVSEDMLEFILWRENHRKKSNKSSKRNSSLDEGF